MAGLSRGDGKSSEQSSIVPECLGKMSTLWDERPESQHSRKAKELSLQKMRRWPIEGSPRESRAKRRLLGHVG